MDKFYLSTIDENAHLLAKKHGFGIEIAEFCTPWFLDTDFDEVDPKIREKLSCSNRFVLHAPFSELFPCAIDKKARGLAAYRYRQAIDIAKSYGSKKVVIHGGYNPKIYFPVWYVEQSILFWKEFLKDDPGVQIVLENVLEETPDMLLNIVKGVNDPRLRLCLDIGHANAYSQVPVMDWLKMWAPYISHFHIHNNDGSADQHNALSEGSIPVKDLLIRSEQLCPDATYTLELMKDAPCVSWLKENELL